MEKSWFYRKDNLNPSSPNSYYRIEGVPNCEGKKTICGIFAEIKVVEEKEIPDISYELLQEMFEALYSGERKTNVILKDD